MKALPLDNRAAQCISALTLLFCAQLLTVGPVAACMAQVRPDGLGTESDGYDSIVVGEVVGVYLAGYVELI